MSEVVTFGETMVMFSPEQSGPLRYVQSFQKKIAGSESNVAIGLVRLGHSCSWISRIGQDEFGQFILHEIRGEGVDTTGVIVDAQLPTGIMFKEVRSGRETKVYYYRKDSAASRLCANDIKASYFESAKLLHLTGINPALGTSCLEATQKAIQIARQNGMLISFDPNLRLKLWNKEKAREVLTALLPQVDIVLPGLDESQILLGTLEPEQLLDEFLKLGVKTIALKMGTNGTWVATENARYKVATFEIEHVVDPIGAGDAFAAGFLSGILEGLPLEECGRMANAMGAMAVTTVGDFEGLPDRRQLEAFFVCRKEILR